MQNRKQAKRQLFQILEKNLTGLSAGFVRIRLFAESNNLLIQLYIRLCSTAENVTNALTNIWLALFHRGSLSICITSKIHCMRNGYGTALPRPIR